MWNKFNPFIHFSPASLLPSAIVTFYSQLILWLGTVSILSHYSYSQINEKELGFMLTGFDSESCLKSSIKTIALWDCCVLVPAITRFFSWFLLSSKVFRAEHTFSCSTTDYFIVYFHSLFGHILSFS